MESITINKGGSRITIKGNDIAVQINKASMLIRFGIIYVAVVGLLAIPLFWGDTFWLAAWIVLALGLGVYFGAIILKSNHEYSIDEKGISGFLNRQKLEISWKQIKAYKIVYPPKRKREVIHFIDQENRPVFRIHAIPQVITAVERLALIHNFKFKKSG